MREVYKMFYRTKGVRYAASLARPPRFRLTVLPKDSIFHFHRYEDGGSPDLTAEDPIYAGYTKKILFKHITDYINPEGTYRRPPGSILQESAKWRKANSANWMMVDKPWVVADSMDQLVVINYGYLDEFNKYMPVQLSKLWRWRNTMKTIFSTMNEIASNSSRNQFLVIKVPPELQGKSVLDRFAPRPDNITTMNLFGLQDDDGLLQLEFWRWLDPELRSRSLLNCIEEKNYGVINFVFEGRSGHQCLVNLAYLNSWIKGNMNRTEMKDVYQFQYETLQKLYLKLMMTLSEISPEGLENQADQELSAAETPVVESPQLADAVETDGYNDPVQGDDEAEGENNAPVALGKIRQIKSQPLTYKEVEAIDKSATSNKPSDYSAELLDDIEADLKVLDDISLQRLSNRGINENEVPAKETDSIPENIPLPTDEEVAAKIFKQTTPSERLRTKLEYAAENNAITAADFRKMNEAVKKYEDGLDPYGTDQPVLKAMEIKPEELLITEERSFLGDNKNVADKGMEKSTLLDFDKHYIKHILKKDVLQAVDALQATGVVIRAHEIETNTTALGTYEHHRLELKPINGAASTVNFTLPVVDKDGTFLAGSNKYILRKQRVDVPIRKIAPSIVSLSTYYGKTFVQTSPKVVNSSISWIIRQINLALVNEGYINGVSLGNVFNNELDTPYIYGALSAEFEKFYAGEDFLSFNYAERHALVGEKPLAKYEHHGRVVCGKTRKGEVIVVDKEDQFFAVGDAERPMGDIFTLLKLGTEKCPVDFSEVRVFSKYVPVGIVLGYYIGLKALLVLTKIKYRTVPARKNKDLQPGEFAVQFKDMSYVFEGKDKKASLIMAGFLDFDKITRLYEAELFEHKEVYLNLLMSKKMGAVYVRELDMMDDAFIDPISRDILVSMNEPTTFRGLLVRATELLLSYRYPVSQDRSVMRDRGYERFAGAVYREMTHAIRQFKNRNLAGRSKVDISPYQVWNSIMKEDSPKIVEDINPIQNLKESEVITFAGNGGRSKETMTKPSRAFHINDVGILSESTVDNAGVGTVAYLSANPGIKDIRGLSKGEREFSPTTMLSTAALVSPASSTDNQRH